MCSSYFILLRLFRFNFFYRFSCNQRATSLFYTLSLHDALPIFDHPQVLGLVLAGRELRHGHGQGHATPSVGVADPSVGSAPTLPLRSPAAAWASRIHVRTTRPREYVAPTTPRDETS